MLILRLAQGDSGDFCGALGDRALPRSGFLGQGTGFYKWEDTLG